MSFDFKTVEAATEGSYLKPGVYKLKPTKAEGGKSKEKNTPYFELTLSTEDDLSVKEKFFVSENTLPRLQYLHEHWVGKKLDKSFKSEKEIVDFFVKLFSSPKVPAKRVVVGGQINGNVTYGGLPYTGFILDADSDLEDGEFAEDSPEWKKYVTVSKAAGGTNKKASAAKQAPVDDEDSKDDDEDGEDTPW